MFCLIEIDAKKILLFHDPSKDFFTHVFCRAEIVPVTPVLMLLTVAGITIAFMRRAHRNGNSGTFVISGAVSLTSGLVTTFLLAAHLASVWLRVAAGYASLADFEQFALLALGVAIFIPGLLCVSLAGALTRGELHAQKRTLAASVVVLGLTLPLSAVQPLPAMIAALAAANLGVLLMSRTNLELSEPAAS
jgi:hypothetical protein